MREVDQALAKAFANGTSSPPSPPEAKSRQARRSVPPAPHFADSPSASYKEAPGLIQWPSLLLQLEQQFQGRYAQLADSLAATRNPRSLLFTSRQRAEGRTTMALALAREFAGRPGRTLLVDADLSNPTIARRLSIRPALGLEEVVRGDHAFDEAILESPLDRLSLLMLQEPVAAPRAFLRNPRWRALLLELRDKFDRIVIDSGPVYSTSAILMPRQPIDAVVMVRNHLLTDLRRLGRARLFIEGKGYPVIGLAETFAASETVPDRGADGDV